ncbi:MAG: hypothetical protein QNK23_08500 [Crocinitomicaceae bacterium]|nr:hypothetical protein [Crocinitomicaceae bacterium]
MILKLKTPFLLFIVLISFSSLAQDSLCECRKTTSIYAEKVSSINIYNEDEKPLEYIRFNSLGDTAQWWKYEYNAEGFEIRLYSTLPSNLFEQKHILDSKGRVTATISTVGDRIDTVDMTSYIFEYNEFGDAITDVYDGGSYAYVYDSLDQKTIAFYLSNEGDTTGRTIYKYDSFGNEIAWEYFENDSLVQSNKSIYDSTGRYISGIRRDGAGEILYSGYSEYDEEGFRYRSYGIDRFSGETINWESLFEKVKCPE